MLVDASLPTAARLTDSHLTRSVSEHTQPPTYQDALGDVKRGPNDSWRDEKAPLLTNAGESMPNRHMVNPLISDSSAAAANPILAAFASFWAGLQRYHDKKRARKAARRERRRERRRVRRMGREARTAEREAAREGNRNGNGRAGCCGKGNGKAKKWEWEWERDWNKLSLGQGRNGGCCA